VKRIFANDDLYRTVVLTILAGLAAVTVAMANRDVYSKAEVDHRLNAVLQHSEDLHRLEDERHSALDKTVEDMRDDIKWIVRQMGGTPSDSREDRNSP
jgi:myosin-crossreactive antigen